MIVSKRPCQWHRRVRLVGIALIAGACGFFANMSSAVASPIKASLRHKDEVRLDAEAGHSWSAYLLAGPKMWSSVVHPSVTPDVRAAIWKALGSDAPESTAWVQFLLWKQSLDPERFALNHPHIAPVLDRISSASLGTQTITPPTTTTPDTTPLTQPQSLTPVVPEPGPWLLALGMTGWGLWWRWRAR
jgi:hypothetical protein